MTRPEPTPDGFGRSFPTAVSRSPVFTCQRADGGRGACEGGHARTIILSYSPLASVSNEMKLFSLDGGYPPRTRPPRQGPAVQPPADLVRVGPACRAGLDLESGARLLSPAPRHQRTSRPRVFAPPRPRMPWPACGTYRVGPTGAGPPPRLFPRHGLLPSSRRRRKSRLAKRLRTLSPTLRTPSRHLRFRAGLRFSTLSYLLRLAVNEIRFDSTSDTLVTSS